MSATRNIHEHQLDNGLRVLIRPMHTAPVVSVWIWYRAGSRCERAGITGISHWVEHMLFKGTPEFPKGEIFKSVCRVGGSNNGFTREDDTVSGNSGCASNPRAWSARSSTLTRSPANAR